MQLDVPLLQVLGGIRTRTLSLSERGALSVELLAVHVESHYTTAHRQEFGVPPRGRWRATTSRVRRKNAGKSKRPAWCYRDKRALTSKN